MRPFPSVFPLSALAILVIVAGPVGAQGLLGRVLGELQGRDGASDLGKPPEFSLPRPDEVNSNIAAIQAELEAAPQPETDPAQTAHRIARRAELDVWRRIRLDLQELTNLEAESDILRQKVDETRQQAEQFRRHGPTEPRPFSFVAVDALVDQHYAQRQRQKSCETELELARDKRDRQAQRLDSRQRRARLAQEAFARAKPHESTRLHDEAERAHLEVRSAEVQLALAQAELAYQGLLSRQVDVDYELLEFRIAQMWPETTFSAADLEQGLQSLTARVQQVQQGLQQWQAAAAATEDRLQAARSEAVQSPIHEEYLRALSAVLRRVNADERLLHDELDRLENERTVWNRRFQIANKTAPQDQISQWREYSKEARQNLDKSRRVLTARIEVVRAELAALESKSDAGNPQIREYLTLQVNELRRLIKIHETEIDNIRVHRWSHSKLIDEMQGSSAVAAAAALVGNSWQQVAAVWNYELLQVEGSPITVKKLVIGLGLILFGFWLSRAISWFIGRAMLPRIGVHGNAIMPIRTIVFYVLFFTFTLFALRIVCVPLTAFTVVGGALAIGVGVGSQAIANNFISGLILLAERPVRVGDTIELEGATGTVEKIGARSTRIRTTRNMEIIVPNSKLLEQTLTNLTLNDDRIRTSVSLGIAYGSPTKRAAELMLVAAGEIEAICQDPEPKVYFVDFGDNALLFEIHYWVSIGSGVDRRMIDSQLRFAIEQLFRDEKIVMAYPQRDIHLDTTSPIQVQVTSNELHRRAA